MSNVNGVGAGPNFFGGMTDQSIEAAGDYLDQLGLGLNYTPPEVRPDFDPFKPIQGENYDPYKVGLTLDKDLPPYDPTGPAPQNQLTPFDTPGGWAPPVETPTSEDSQQPPGSLVVNPDGTINTPGGYKIEATKRHEWIITAPDGKTTRIWGDPHVDEGDGGKWDFKRDTTFVLADGTRIQAKTAPWGDKGWTVTDSLNIISGNERVNVSGIRDGKGTPGAVTQDGQKFVDAWRNKDVVAQGKDGDDWTHKGKEIVGSTKQGEVFTLGKRQTMMGQEGRELVNWLRSLMPGLSSMFDNILKGLTGDPTPPGAANAYAPFGLYDPTAHLNSIYESFGLVRNTLDVASSYFDLQAAAHANRQNVL